MTAYGGMRLKKRRLLHLHYDLYICNLRILAFTYTYAVDKDLMTVHSGVKRDIILNIMVHVTPKKSITHIVEGWTCVPQRK